MIYARKPYMDARRAARLAAGDRQYSVWFTPQAWAYLRIARQNGRSVEKVIEDALEREAAQVVRTERLKTQQMHEEQATQ